MPFHNVDEIRLAAAGRWADILIAAGIPAAVLDGRSHPCPKCGGRDRFAVFPDFDHRGAVHCRKCFTRGSTLSPGDGISTLRWWSNLSFPDSLSFLADTLGIECRSAIGIPTARARRSAVVAFSANPKMSQQDIDGHTDFSKVAYHRIDSKTLRRLARRLFVSPASLTSLRVGVTPDSKCSTWPMRNENGDVIGVRIVALPWTDAGRAKWSRRGSQSGIFVPRERVANRKRLYVTEGASDTAAAVSMGLWAIGRASCSSSTFFVDRFTQIHQPSRLTIIADNDPAGINGANRLARLLCEDLPPSLSQVDVVTPPGPSMDLRAWIADGANQVDICSAKSIAIHRPSQQTTFDFV